MLFNGILFIKNFTVNLSACMSLADTVFGKIGASDFLENEKSKDFLE